METTWLGNALMYRVERLTVPHEQDRVVAAKPPAGVMHTTEGTFASALAVFKVHFAPHFMVSDDRIVQFVPLGTIAAALEHKKGTVETNRWARAQIEVVAHSKLPPWQPDGPTFDRLAALVATLETAAGIPLRRPWPDTLDAGTKWATEANPRRTHSKWGAESGWFGHVEIPGNSHWDPGSLRYGALFERARELRFIYALTLLGPFLARLGVVRRAAWGARPAAIPMSPANLDWDYDTIVVHHSGRRGLTDPRAVQNEHMDRNHWCDVGYHFMIGPAGQIYEGRSLLFKGSHVRGANTGKVGILVMGDFERELLGLLGREPDPRQLASLLRLARGLTELFPHIAVLGGHKDFVPSTACPGNLLYPRLGGLRAALGLQTPIPGADRH